MSGVQPAELRDSSSTAAPPRPASSSMRPTSSLSPSTAALWNASICLRSMRVAAQGRASQARPSSMARRPAAAEIPSPSIL